MWVQINLRFINEQQFSFQQAHVYEHIVMFHTLNSSILKFNRLTWAISFTAVNFNIISLTILPISCRSRTIASSAPYMSSLSASDWTLWPERPIAPSTVNYNKYMGALAFVFFNMTKLKATWKKNEENLQVFMVEEDIRCLSKYYFSHKLGRTTDLPKDDRH